MELRSVRVVSSRSTKRQVRDGETGMRLTERSRELIPATR